MRVFKHYVFSLSDLLPILQNHATFTFSPKTHVLLIIGYHCLVCWKIHETWFELLIKMFHLIALFCYLNDLLVKDGWGDMQLKETVDCRLSCTWENHFKTQAWWDVCEPCIFNTFIVIVKCCHGNRFRDSFFVCRLFKRMSIFLILYARLSNQ